MKAKKAKSSSATQKKHAPKSASKPRASTFPIVGIGASAGGFEAMRQLLDHLPPDTGMAFVFVQHLDPTHESALTALFKSHTRMPVKEARHDMRLEPNHVYVIPPNKTLGLVGRCLQLSPRRNNKRAPAPIDLFFQALAEEEGHRAIGLVLSGTGTDGTQGLEAIKAAGGITLAQEEKSAKFSTMPTSAVDSGCVDFVLPPQMIAQELARIAGHPYIGSDLEAVPTPSDGQGVAFDEILTALRRQTGVDFTSYKHATLHRRIQRRMLLHKCETQKHYADVLRENAEEVTSLFHDMLITVTGFFRDPGVFRVLKQRVFPRIVKLKQPDDPIRVWVPGCSTGEEVYSVAMVLQEFLQERKLHHPIQIFGTDINTQALEKARAGTYRETIRNDLSLERLRHFFVKSDPGYRITKTIRDQCVFARQNVVADPPFSNMDMISCRNLLIYLSGRLQRKVLPIFHYALRPSGHLLLGSSETVGGFSELFELLDKKHKIYTRKDVFRRPAVTFSPGLPDAQQSKAPPAAPPAAPAPSTLMDVQEQADRIVLVHHTPPGAVINQHLEVVQFRGRTRPFLEHAHGEASLNILKMARGSLGLDLRGAISEAMKHDTPVQRPRVLLDENDRQRYVNIEVIPFKNAAAGEKFYLVLFKPVETDSPGPERDAKGRARRSRDVTEANRLREELAESRESLKTLFQEQEAINEELRSANEEILSSNEELQSTNEELETAKEELQSTNEELMTLNDELEGRNNDLELANNDVTNLLASVNIPIIIVSADLRIRRFTDVAGRFFNFIPADIGRPLSDINLNLNLTHLDKLVGEAIDTLQSRELDVRDRDGHWWSLRIRPYRTAERKIDGAVIALVDIHALKFDAERVDESRILAEGIVNTVRHPLLVLEENLVVCSANQAFCRHFQTASADTVHRRIYDLGNGQWNIPTLRTLLEEILPHKTVFQDFEVEHEFPRIGRRRFLLNGRQLSVESGRKQLILLAFEDVTGTRRTTSTISN